MTTYTHILDLAKEAEPPADGILSRTIFQDDKIAAEGRATHLLPGLPRFERRAEKRGGAEQISGKGGWPPTSQRRSPRSFRPRSALGILDDRELAHAQDLVEYWLAVTATLAFDTVDASRMRRFPTGVLFSDGQTNRHCLRPEFTFMGYSLSWIAVKGKLPQAVRDEFSFGITGRREEIPESDLSAVEMPNGWYLIVSNHSEQVVSDAAMRRLASSGCEIVTCFVEEHVMISRASGWKEGRLTWSVTHDSQKGLLNLDVQGEPPPEFAAIRDQKFAEQAAGERDCDYLFDVPVETARSVVGYRHDADVPGLSGEVFEVLAPTPDKRSFWQKFVDGWFRTPRSPTHR